MVELAALEKRYGATHRGFESLSLRQNPVATINWKGDRVVEGTGLENRRALTRTEGSNPSPSARHDIMKERLETLAKRGVATIAALASLALSASSHPSISPEQAKHTYVVGMGDSVASGAGLGNYDDTTTECRRSPEAYARQLEASGIPSDNITLVACRGAGPEHISGQQFDDQPPQINALSPETDIVTLSLGANMIDLNAVFDACLHERCGTRSEMYIDVFRRLYSDEYRQSLEQAYRSILEHAPNAQLYINLYTTPIQPRDICPTIINNDTDHFVASFIETVNQAIRDVVASMHEPRITLVEPPKNVDACATFGLGVVTGGDDVGHPTTHVHHQIAKATAEAILHDNNAPPKART